MVGPLSNGDAPTPFIPGGFCYGPASNPFSLAVTGSSAFLGEVNTNGNVIVGSNCLAQEK